MQKANHLKKKKGLIANDYIFLRYLLSKIQTLTLLNLPNWSFFMTATYFSSRERKTDRGLGFTAAFLEYSAIFFSVI